jgi:hypothetical protein
VMSYGRESSALLEKVFCRAAFSAMQCLIRLRTAASGSKGNYGDCVTAMERLRGGGRFREGHRLDQWIGTHKAYDKIDVTEVRHGH